MNQEEIYKDIMKLLKYDGLIEGVDMSLGHNPARIYFTFQNTGEYNKIEHPVLSGIDMGMEELFKIITKYGLERDLHQKTKHKPTTFSLAFKLDKSFENMWRKGRKYKKKSK